MAGSLLSHLCDRQLRDFEVRVLVADQFGRVFVVLRLGVNQLHPDHTGVKINRTVNVLDRKTEMPVGD